MYKYTRKEIVDAWLKYRNIEGDFGRNLKDDLLAQKEDRKECKHIPDREVGLNVWSCKKCRCCFVHKPTPSPLDEIKELREVKFGMDSNQTFENFYDAINSLIRNQKKLYQFIKEKL